eukprot:IDg18580t1
MIITAIYVLVLKPLTLCSVARTATGELHLEWASSLLRGKMPAKPKNEDDVEAATLSRRALSEISQITQDVRMTQKRLSELDCAPLAVMDADAVDAIKDLFYVVSNEDPLNVMPARKLLCDQHVVATCLLPLLAAVNSDSGVA